MAVDHLKSLPPGTIAVKDESVRLDLAPALTLALHGTVGPIFRELGSPVVVTSGSESHDAQGNPVKHSETSLHWSGHAADIRIWYLDVEQRRRAVDLMIGALGRNFDVVLEEDHIHLEYQPRRPAR